MILMKTDKACGRCPNSLICMTLKPLPKGAAYCQRCGCIVFKHDDVTFLCTRIRDGEHQRPTLPSQAHTRGTPSRSTRAYRAFGGCLARTYEGCVHMRRKRRKDGLRLARRCRSWKDCVEYFKNKNGFDLEL